MGSPSVFKMASSSRNDLALGNGNKLEQATYGQTGHTDANLKENGRNAPSEADGIDFELHLCFHQAFCDEIDCMWLSSGSSTPPCSQSSDNNRIDSCLDYNDEQTNMWRSKDVELGGRSSFSEASSSTVDSPWALLGAWDEPLPMQHCDLDAASARLIALEGEEPKWDVDDIDFLDQNFPGASLPGRTNSQAQPSRFLTRGHYSNQPMDIPVTSGSSNSIPIITPPPEDGLDLECPSRVSDTDEPLFWPFDQSSYWSIALEWNCMDISPPVRSTLSIERPRGSYPSKKLLQLKWDQTQRGGSPWLDKRNIQRTHRRGGRLSSSSTSSGSTSDGTKCRLSRKVGGSERRQPCSLIKQRESPQKTSLNELLSEFEADGFRIYLAGEIPIEALLGLDEFDGHESIGRPAASRSLEGSCRTPLRGGCFWES